MYRADLHIHTAVSDCSLQTEAILAGAKAAGITHICLLQTMIQR